MSRRRKSPVDRSDYLGVVVTCPECHWRDHTMNVGRAWYLLARHLKQIHGDLHATDNARKNAWHHGYSF